MTDPLAERLYNLMRKQPITCCRSDAEDIATATRAFLAERVTVDAIKKAMAGSCPHGQGARRACATCSAYRALEVLRREMGG